MTELFNQIRRPVAALCALFVLGMIIDRSFAEDQLLFDFDQKRLSHEWSAVGKINARRETAPQSDSTAQWCPTENGVTVETEGKGGLFAKSGTIPTNWESFDKISFWVYRSPDEARQRPQSIFEVQVYEPGGKARFWRKVTVDHTGWQQISVPLSWFRWGTGQRPRWDRMDRFGFWFRDEANLSFDTIWVTKDGTEKTAYFSHDELLDAAFPNAGKAARIAKMDKAVVLTNSPQLDITRLADHLDGVASAVHEDLPFLNAPVRRPMLVVFATRAKYENFAPSFARKFNSNAEKPKSTGFTFHGIATSFWDKEYGTLRPTYTHEFVHSYFAQSARIPNKTEWLHEGLASKYQIRYHPQANLREIVRTGLERKDFHSPLSELCNGEQIPSNRYWQAMTLVDMLIQSRPYNERLPKLIEAFQEAKSTNLQPHLESVLHTNWDDLTSDWQEFCRSQYLSETP